MFTAVKCIIEKNIGLNQSTLILKLQVLPIMDRRYRRTERALNDAILTLIREKPFPAITVSEIADRADIARKTFYAHYTGKDDLLWHSLESRFEAIATHTAPLDPETLLADGKPLSYPVFQHIADYALFYRGMLAEGGDGPFILRLWDYIAAQSFAKHETLRQMAPFMTVPPDLLAPMLAGALLGAARWWLHTEMTLTPEQMAYRFSQVMAPGVLASMGLE